MTFWAYMLHCNGGYFYVGHTDDLDRRIAQHMSGALPGFSRDHLPVTLVWSEAFGTRLEALETERRVKGWRREKKLALIRGDWDLVRSLAKKKGSASTSSARTGEVRSLAQTVGAELVETLLSHPAHPPVAVDAIQVDVRREGERLLLSYRVADADALRVTNHAAVRADDLWRHTCFEAFVAGVGPGYCEFNFAPSGAWAAYAFDGYRTGMREADAAPAVRWRDGVLTAAVVVPIGDDWRVNLSAVIEEPDGVKSYWALTHPDGPPDFHDPACFVLTLAAS